MRVTLTLPRDLWEAAEAAVRRGAARSRNALVAEALRRYLRDLEEAEIDRQIAGMRDDPAWCALIEQVEADFAVSDWEALGLGEA